jgi:hypothetical protein
VTRSRLKQAYLWVVILPMSLIFSVRVWEDYPSSRAWHYVIVAYWLLAVGSLVWLGARRVRRPANRPPA